MRKTENIINRTGINKTECKKTGHSKENKIPGGWNGSLFFLIIILGITLGIFAGCKNIFVPEPPATPEAAGPGGGITVSLRLFTGSARSVMPGMEALTWEITASQGDITISVADGAYPKFSLSLPVSGTWTFTVRGTNSANDEIFTGSAEQNIESGSTTSISIPLSPGSGMGDSGATGKLNLTIKPKNVLSMRLNYRIDRSENWETSASFDGGDYTISNEPLSVGQHTLDLYFFSNSDKGKFYFCTVAVNIWPGMTSDQWIKTNGEEYINDSGEFFITDDMVNKFVKTMGSVVYVNASAADTPATGSFFAPVNSVSTAVDILRKANPGGKCNGTIMVSGETTIDREIEVLSGETLTIKGTGPDASIKNTSGGVFNIASDGSLTLGENITLTGTNATGNGGAVYVNGGTFTMENGSAITGGQAIYGGGVYVAGGNFIMEGNSIITESSATGTTASGGAVYVAGGTFTMNGTAILQGNTATTHGGGVCISGGTFTMSDSAVISGNTATRSGGGVFVSGSGNFIMEGGTIGGTGGESHNSAENGGGVYIFEGTFTMSGDAVISGNIAINSSGSDSGGGVYVEVGTFTMSGSPNISGNYRLAVDNINNVYLASGKTITIGAEGLTGGTIGVTAENVPSGNAVPITDEDVTGADRIFSSDDPDYSIVKYNGAVCLSDAETKYEADSGTKLGTFVAALAAVNNSAGGGTITLLKDIDGRNAVFEDDSFQPQPITFSSDDETRSFILDLNGKTINRELRTPTTDGSVIRIKGGTLTIKDSSATKSDGTGGTGKITGGNSSNTGGGIHITSDPMGPVFGSLILESGSISGNTADSSNGGGIYIDSDCALTMEGGSIDGNTVKNRASSHGGGVFVYGTFTMENGIITKNSSEQGNGGGVNIGSDGTFTMIDGTISGNTATQKGGGVYVSSTGSFTLGSSSVVSSSPVVSGNTKTDSSPNNVYLDGTILLIGGELKKSVDSGNIGISMATPGEEFTSGWSNSDLRDSTFFFSDDTKRTVALSGSELSLNLVHVEGGSCILNGKQVTLSSFWISPYEVTQAEFESIMTGNANDIEPNPSEFQGEEKLPAEGEEQGRRPVEKVNWYDAIVYCNLLSIKEGLTPCYTIKGSTTPADWGTSPTSDSVGDYDDWKSVTCNFDANGYRLPTEAEWEYAARGGKTGITDGSWGNTYSGSTTPDDVAWYTGNSDSKTHEVGKKQDNALGLYDMSGNAGEWCWDWRSDPYPSNTENPAGPGTGEKRVRRGGTINNTPVVCDVGYRNNADPYQKGFCFGFRVVSSIR